MKRFLESRRGTLALFLAAALLMLGSTMGSAQAALTYFSSTYTSRIQMNNIGVALLENGTVISSRGYDAEAQAEQEEAGGTLLSAFSSAEGFQLGRSYPEVLSVQNGGTIDQYVRVSVYRYWTRGTGESAVKLPELSPDLIKLAWDNLGNGWAIDEGSSTAERTVLYYTRPLASGETTLPFSSTLEVDNSVASKVTQTAKEENGGTVITTTYDYDGVEFHVEVRVNAVQTHNAEDAIRSAWGCRAAVSPDGSLSIG